MRLTEVELSTPSPRADAAELADLGFLPSPDRVTGGGSAQVLRTCADPYGCRVVLRPGARAAVTRLTWRPGDGEHFERMVGVLERRDGLGDLVASAGRVGDGYRVEHPGGATTELHWRQDREWAAGPAMSCPLHPEGSTQLCVEHPPLIVGVDVPAPAGALERWMTEVLGLVPTAWDLLAPAGAAGPELRAAPEGGAGLRVRSGRAHAGRAWTTSGGLRLSVVADASWRVGELESEALF